MRIKAFLYIFVVTVLLAASALAAVPTDLNKEFLTGKVKSIDEDTATMKLKKGVLVEDSRYRSRSISFDRQGRMTYKWQKIDKLSPNEYFYTYEGDDKRFTRSVFINLFGVDAKKNPDRISLTILRYDADKNEIFEDVYAERESYVDALTQKYTYTFDKENRLVEDILAGSNGIPAFLTRYVYGTERLPTERRGYIVGNPIPAISKYVYELDSTGNWTKQTAETTLAKKDAEATTVITYRKISYYK
ncbi:MAG TPA: hypothetical protein VGC76_07105 [Pyrinomonadaceae bacterium]|jgi:hypothetical protein